MNDDNVDDTDLGDETNVTNKQQEKESPNRRKEKLLASSQILKDYQFNEQDNSLKIEIFVCLSTKTSLSDFDFRRRKWYYVI
jgi:hypothetical protein